MGAARKRLPTAPEHVLAYVTLLDALPKPRTRNGAEEYQVIKEELAAVILCLKRLGKVEPAASGPLFQSFQHIVRLIQALLVHRDLVAFAVTSGVLQAVAQSSPWIELQDEDTRKGVTGILDVITYRACALEVWREAFVALSSISETARAEIQHSAFSKEWEEMERVVRSRDFKEGLTLPTIALCDNDDVSLPVFRFTKDLLAEAGLSSQCSRVGDRTTFAKCLGCWYTTYCNEGKGLLFIS